MNGIVKGMLLALIIAYVVSPIDLCPGPVDDLILMAMGVGGFLLPSGCDEY